MEKRYPAIDRMIEQVRQRFCGSEERIAGIFERCVGDTLRNAIKRTEDGRVFVITGDIPAFDKTDAHEREEEHAVERLLSMLDEPYRTELTVLFAEMNALETEEAKLYKALDKMETLLSHNEAPLDTWLPLEYEANLTYGQEQVDHSAWLKVLKDEIKQDSLEKIQKNTPKRVHN